MQQEEPHLPSEALLATALVFAPFAFGTTESWSKAVLFLLTVAFSAVRWRRFGFQAAAQAPRPPLLWAIVALGLLAALQCINGVSPLALELAQGPFTAARTATLEWLFTWSSYVMLLLFAPGLFRSRAVVERFAWLLLLCGAVLAFVGLAQMQAGNEFYFGLRKVSRFRAPFGPFPNKNHAAAYLVLSGFAGAGLLASEIQRFRGSRASGRLDEAFGRIVSIAVLEFLVLIGLLLARSRGALGSLVCASGLAAALWTLKYWKAGIFASLAIFLGGAVALASGIRLVGIPLSEFLPAVGENSLTFRYAMAADGVKIISAHPIFGVGLGALGAVYPLWMDSAMKGFTADHLHCDPIELAVEAGIPLAAAYYLSFLISLAIAARLTRPHAAPPSLINISFLAGVGAILVHQILDFPSHIMSLQFTTMACLSAGWGLGRLEQEPVPNIQPPTRILASISFLVISIIGGALAMPRLTAAYFDLLASRYPQPAKQYYQFQALRWEPTYDRHLKYSLMSWQMANDNPAARAPLLRTALAHSSAALELDPLRRHAKDVHAGLLVSLGRHSDARAFQDSRSNPSAPYLDPRLSSPH